MAPQLFELLATLKPVPFGGSQQLAENKGWREEKNAEIRPASSNQGQQLLAANGAEPWAFAQGSMRQRIYSLEVVAEGAGFEPAVGFKPYDDLANRWFQPLTHPSAETVVDRRGWSDVSNGNPSWPSTLPFRFLSGCTAAWSSGAGGVVSCGVRRAACGAIADCDGHAPPDHPAMHSCHR
ncbi:hypothetical protein MTBSS4_210008 [Magnetospirillum sp. SS-4]|nr:hypothetical protein MTBSS4_210008 [Magnetospirillum sp. SS-4]